MPDEVMEHFKESEDAQCPCCGEPLLVHLSVRVNEAGNLTVHGFHVAHRGSPDGRAREYVLDQLPRRE